MQCCPHLKNYEIMVIDVGVLLSHLYPSFVYHFNLQYKFDKNPLYCLHSSNEFHMLYITHFVEVYVQVAYNLSYWPTVLQLATRTQQQLSNQEIYKDEESTSNSHESIGMFCCSQAIFHHIIAMASVILHTTEFLFSSMPFNWCKFNVHLVFGRDLMLLIFSHES